MKALHITRYLIGVLMIPAGINAQTTGKIKNNKNKEIIMNTAQQNKAIVLKIYEQCLNKRNFDLLNELVSEAYTGIQGKKGAAGFQEPMQALIRSFPDMQWNLTNLIAEDDKVFASWKVQGTHTNPFNNIPATGKFISSEGTGVLTLKNGKVISTHVLTDRVGFMQALEVLPADVNVLFNRKAHNGQVNFIDKFFVPAAAIKEFRERVKINRNFIEKLPGFIEDAAYEYTDNDGNLIFITVAMWQSAEALNKAKEAVQAEYKKEGFDAPAMFKRLGITVDRGIYTRVHE
ncbi:ester cyclase [Niastella populi]|uniref:ester cyclase n=1 Tax=Niastella populi TaxID=550983 RepID=UPI0013FD57AC|nr:ester cyclase [Niastella populi]